MDQFKEEQKFNQLWIWLLMIIPAFVIFIPFIMQLVTGEPVGNKPAPTWVLGLISLVLILLPYLFSRLKLITNIDQETIRFDYGILGKKNIPWTAVEKAEIVNYGFVGYGLRLTVKYGTVYNVGGKYGLMLTLKTGKKITIGTQEKRAMEDFMTSRQA